MSTIRPQSRFLSGTCLLVFGLAIAGTTEAAKWTGSANVAPAVTFTDNVCLSDRNKQSDWVGLMTPGGQIQATGPKASFSAGGYVQFNTLTDSQLEDSGCGGGALGDREKFSPVFSANGRAKLYEDWLSINASGRADQNEIVSGAGGAGDTLDRRGNTNNYYRYSVSPVIANRFKKIAKYQLRYAYDEVINSEDVVADSHRHALNADISNGGASQVSWALLGSSSTVGYSDYLDGTSRDDTELSSARMRLGYQFDRRWQVNGTYGWEFNDFETANDYDVDGNAWDIGIRWTPTPRTTVALGSGDRFFGSTPRMNIAHTYKRSVFTASYNKEITYDFDIRSLQNDLETNPDFLDNAGLYSQSPILDERFTLGYAYSGRYATLNLSGSYSEQTRAEDGAQGTFKGWALSYSPLISSTYSFTGTVAWNEDEPRGAFGVPDSITPNSSETWSFNLQAARPINERMDLSVSYQYSDFTSDELFGEYQENRIMATLNLSL